MVLLPREGGRASKLAGSWFIWDGMISFMIPVPSACPLQILNQCFNILNLQY